MLNFGTQRKEQWNMQYKCKQTKSYELDPILKQECSLRRKMKKYSFGRSLTTEKVK